MLEILFSASTAKGKAVHMPYFGRRALIVEQGAIGRILLEKLLRQFGFEVRAVPGAEDVRALPGGESPYDLAVVDADIEPAEINGLMDLLRGGQGARTRILLTVSHDRPSLLPEGPAPDGVALKPIGKASLERLIDEMFSSDVDGGGGGNGGDGVPRAASPPGLDLDAGMERLGGGFDVLRNLLAIFLRENKHAATSLRALAETGDYAKLQAEAHALKGAAGNISAQALHKAALNVEKAAAGNDPHTLRSALDELEGRLDVVLDSIQNLI